MSSREERRRVLEKIREAALELVFSLNDSPDKPLIRLPGSQSWSMQLHGGNGTTFQRLLVALRQVAHLLHNDSYATKRELYYRAKEAYGESQGAADRAITAACALLRENRSGEAGRERRELYYRAKEAYGESQGAADRAITAACALLRENRSGEAGRERRELYYRAKEAYGESQGAADRAITAACALLRENRSALHVVATAKGLVAGDVSWRCPDSGNLRTVGETPELIPARGGDLTEVASGARFVLVVEKDAVFHSLLDQGFLATFAPALLVTGKGYPDLGTRGLVRRLVEELGLPGFLLVDADVHGLEIAATYKFGPKKQTWEAGALAAPGLELLGLLRSEAEGLPIAPTDRLPMADAEFRKLDAMKQRADVAQDRRFMSELSMLGVLGTKVETEALNSVAHDFLARRYLPSKLGRFLANGAGDQVVPFAPADALLSQGSEPESVLGEEGVFATSGGRAQADEASPGERLWSGGAADVPPEEEASPVERLWSAGTLPPPEEEASPEERLWSGGSAGEEPDATAAPEERLWSGGSADSALEDDGRSEERLWSGGSSEEADGGDSDATLPPEEEEEASEERLWSGGSAEEEDVCDAKRRRLSANELPQQAKEPPAELWDD